MAWSENSLGDDHCDLECMTADCNYDVTRDSGIFDNLATVETNEKLKDDDTLILTIIIVMTSAIIQNVDMIKEIDWGVVWHP